MPKEVKYKKNAYSNNPVYTTVQVAQKDSP